MVRRFETVEDIAWRGLWLRLWCFGCARSAEIDAAEVLQSFTSKGWPLDLASARARFRCRRCRSADNVLILPASPPPPPPPPPAEPARTWEQETEAFFHGMWTKKKRRSDDYGPRVKEILRALDERQRPR